jgi:hypothetical protein
MKSTMVLYKSHVIGIPARILWYIGTENIEMVLNYICDMKIEILKYSKRQCKDNKAYWESVWIIFGIK